MLRGLAPVTDPAVLVGHDTADDAAVYRIGPDLAIVQTVDLFPPVVDDPYQFGQIAAANSLSDVYAMGARPIMALGVVGFPLSKLKLEVLSAILRGGQDKAREAGIDIVGGHSIDDLEPKYGLVVTGLVHPDRVLRNVGARPGDALVLTKPIGTGILTTAIKRGALEPAHVDAAVACMATLNRVAAECLEGLPVSACTDVTGYGLLGHLSEMARGSRVTARVHLGDVPLLPRARELVAQGVLPGGTRRNLAWVQPWTRFDEALPESDRLLLADAQTSGGLLVALPAAAAARYLDAIGASGYALAAAVVGEVVEESDGGVVVTA